MATVSKPQRPNGAPNSYEFFSVHFKARPDLGFVKMLLDVALLPRDPFKPGQRRRFKKGFVAAMLFPGIAVLWFIYFSLPPIA